MGQTKRLLQRRLEHWRTSAAQWIGGTEEEEIAASTEQPVQEASHQAEQRSIELKPAVYERCKQVAEAQRMTVEAVVHQMIEQYWTNRSGELLTPITREQQDRNPLLLLDALSKRNFQTFGEPAYEAE